MDLASASTLTGTFLFAINQHNPATRKTKAEKWGGALPTAIYAGAPIPFLDVGK